MAILLEIMAPKREPQSEVASFESESEAPEIAPVAERTSEVASMLAEAGTEGDTETAHQEGAAPVEAVAAEAVAPEGTAEKDYWTGSFVQKVQERSKGFHDPSMRIQRSLIEHEVAVAKLFDEKKNNGVTPSFEECRIGLKGLRAAAKTLNGFLEDMEE